MKRSLCFLCLIQTGSLFINLKKNLLPSQTFTPRFMSIITVVVNSLKAVPVKGFRQNIAYKNKCARPYRKGTFGRAKSEQDVRKSAQRMRKNSRLTY